MFKVLQHIIFVLVMAVFMVENSSASVLAEELSISMSKTDMEKLMNGEVFISVEKVVGEHGKYAHINSAVQIDAQPKAIWSVLIDCDRAPSYVPGLKKCEMLEVSGDGLWDVRRHINKPAVFLPKMVSEFRCDYNFPTSIKFVSVGGDLQSNSGKWALRYDEKSGKTIVSYTARIASKTVIPDNLIRKILKKNVPKVMSALRQEVIKDQLMLSKQPVK